MKSRSFVLIANTVLFVVFFSAAVFALSRENEIENEIKIDGNSNALDLTDIESVIALSPARSGIENDYNPEKAVKESMDKPDDYLEVSDDNLIMELEQESIQ